MDFIEFCEKITNKKLSAWQKEMLLRHAEIINQQRRTPMDEKKNLMEPMPTGDYLREMFANMGYRIPPLSKGFLPPKESNNFFTGHKEEPELVRVNPRAFCFPEFIRTKPDVLFAGECSTEEILDLIEEREEPMESLRDKKIKSVTIECADGKTYVGNVRRIEGNPYCIRECIVEVAVGNPVGKVGIKEVIFANPSTIVKWTDGTETVVSCMDNVKVIENVVDGKKIKKKKPMKCDTYSKETGLAMAISKKFFGNEGSYNKIFKELCGVEE